MELSELVHQRILEFRKKQGLTQNQFAEKLGVAPHIIRNLEQRKQDWSLLYISKVCAAFAVPASSFVGECNNLEMAEFEKAFSSVPNERLQILREIFELIRETDARSLSILVDVLRITKPK